MHSVAIVGAGELGGTIAHALARHDAVRAITLIDESGRVAAGKALDIAQAAPVEGFATELTGTTDLSNAASAAVVVIADRVTGGEWQGEDALMLLKRLTQTASSAVIVCAGASARELVDRGVRELKMSRARLFGSAPEALAGGVRALVALAVNDETRRRTGAASIAREGACVVAARSARAGRRRGQGDRVDGRPPATDGQLFRCARLNRRRQQSHGRAASPARCFRHGRGRDADADERGPRRARQCDDDLVECLFEFATGPLRRRGPTTTVEGSL
ncbi:MAG: hypothetical protein AUH43_21580 [Acidobacteria bacterium 13_1_40CM_65_14]|nr:MAG: hypothetical protein AUH43_21580 [Acidobacteria bacterium 13_1_40CM_65_14]